VKRSRRSSCRNPDPELAEGKESLLTRLGGMKQSVELRNACGTAALGCDPYGLLPPVCFPVFKSTSNGTSLSASASQRGPATCPPRFP